MRTAAIVFPEASTCRASLTSSCQGSKNGPPPWACHQRPPAADTRWAPGLPGSYGRRRGRHRCGKTATNEPTETTEDKRQRPMPHGTPPNVALSQNINQRIVNRRRLNICTIGRLPFPRYPLQLIILDQVRAATIRRRSRLLPIWNLSWSVDEPSPSSVSLEMAFHWIPVRRMWTIAEKYNLLEYFSFVPPPGLRLYSLSLSRSVAATAARWGTPTPRARPCRSKEPCILTSLGGRAAEPVYYGDKAGISTGAAGDLASATEIAKAMLIHDDMDEEFGLMALLCYETAKGPVASDIQRRCQYHLK